MVKEVYLFDDGEAINVRDINTDEMLYKYTYRDKGTLIWNYDDAWRRLRELHLTHDLYKEIFKCKCGKILRIPDKFEARCSEVNRIEYDVKCSCGNVITIQCDTLKVKQEVSINSSHQ